MIILLGFAFLAGMVTILSPCILPVLPVILAGTTGTGKARPWGIITGFILTFTIFTLTLSTLVRSLGLDPEILRWVAGGFIGVFALILIIPALKEGFMKAVNFLTSRLSAPKPGVIKKPSGGFWAGMGLGASLGLVWTPCAGPIMASVLTLALTSQVDSEAIFITLAYSLGTAVPLFLIVQGGRALLNRFPFLTRKSELIQKVFGVLMLLTSIALFTGVDRRVQTWILETFPSYENSLTSLEENEAVKLELEKRGQN